MADAFKLKLSAVSSGYGAVDVVNGVSLAIRPGEIFALMGKNGMGKTTLLKTILGFLRVGN
ncbi:ATP-binding cassette domain-containing protein, partial [Rhizobium ruizarguesonis]